ncbi:MAG: spermidine synthase [Brachymonas sp.]|nr:spermidine synthase [Brachymonas sp.]
MKRTQLPVVNMSEMGGIRYLHLGTEWVQGSMLIDKPFQIELEYVQRMMAWLLFFDPLTVKKRHALQLGLGSGAITKSCYKTLKMNTTVLEINPAVVAACQHWFKLPPQDKRLHIILGDAMKTLTNWEHSAQEIRRLDAKLASNFIDCAQVDLYDHEAAAPVLDSADFYRAVRDTLTDEGIMTVNLFGRSSSFDKSLAQISAAFGEDAVWSFKPTKEGNTVILAQRTPSRPKRDLLAARAEQIEAMFELPARKWLRLLKPLVK